jgi:hypothetical protein
MDIFPHVNLIVIGLWLIFFVAVPAWCEKKYNPPEDRREYPE